jgi:dihydrofolate synthase/folylpolyglutamate synthase
MKTYSEVLSLLNALPVMPDRPPSLDPTVEGLRRLGFHQWGFSPERVVIVAGTNGKGSTCASLEALLLSAGKRVGFYSSPHLVDATERFRVNGSDVERDIFVRAYEAVRKKMDDLFLTQFEIHTLMAVWIFCSSEAIRAVDLLILEVGLGGEWDATNAVPHSTCVITPLSLDHENLLGKGLPNIARAKFGVIGPGNLVVHAPFETEVQLMARETQNRTKSRWVERTQFRFLAQKKVEAEPEFAIETRWGRSRLALPGLRGAENAALALTVFSELGFDPRAHLHALPRTRWLGRMHKLQTDATLSRAPIYLSGDHNCQGVESLIELLEHYSWKNILILASTAQDKDAASMLTMLSSLPRSKLFLTRNPFRGADLSFYGDWLKRAEGAWESVEEAFRQVVHQAREGDLVLVTGSLYLVGEIQKKFGAPAELAGAPND